MDPFWRLEHVTAFQEQPAFFVVHSVIPIVLSVLASSSGITDRDLRFFAVDAHMTDMTVETSPLVYLTKP